MSGGHWGYQSHELQERAEWMRNVLLVLAQVEHELDWGVSCDTCLSCARNRVGVAWEEFFEFDGQPDRALMVLRDHKSYRCSRCGVSGE